ncbi:zinc finger protein 883-like isoform X1 [Anopheles cruzii]|uniref:zinc finger protein 883-like isoform X1 n=2 Tax=Anopheles cruzii TaxID=68878 RepID=UPI0022EC1A0B|nr:zinc finger protein 883-like isoform X1 [Anopheles cruzii]
METIKYLKKALSSGNSSVCRLCLSPDVASEPLRPDEVGKYLIQKIFDCTSVQIMPLTGIPSVLCTVCKRRVEDFYLFRYQCIKNNEVLNEFAAELSKSPLGNSESEITVHSNEHVQQSNVSSSISLLNEVPRTFDVNNISLDHTYNAQETNIANEFDSNGGLYQPKVNLEHNDDYTCEVLDQVDPLETEPKQSANPETNEHIKMNIKEARNQYLKDPASSTFQVLPQVDLQLLQEPIERIHTEEPPFVCHFCNDAFITRETMEQHAKTHNKDKQHKCPHCSASFVAHQRLVIHLRHHTGEKPFECQVCHKAYISEDGLKSHMRVHNKDQQYQCPQCSAKFAQSTKLTIHIRTHHNGKKPIVCKICSKAFAVLSRLARHMHTHNQKKHFICHYCSAKFTYATTLENHIRRTHASAKIPSRPYQCKICNKSFKTLSTLIHHKNIHTNERRYECPHCPSKFSNSCNLKTHIRFHTGERPYVCKVCDKAFYTSSHLKTHAKIHNKDDQHQCSYCPARFAQPGSLTIHIRKHTGERPFMCEICAAKFKHSTTLKTHIRRAHESIPSKPVECNICNKVLSSPSSLYSHKKTHQSSSTKLKTHAGEEKSNKPAKCNICNKVFGSLRSLWGHMKSHELKLVEDRKYKCPTCPAKFCKSGPLKKHIRHHTGERPYECKLCGKAFHTSGNLNAHGKTHNKD